MKIKIAQIVALVLALASVTALTWRQHGCPQTGIDDANIFFSYAENIASGNGFTYARNGEPIEGFTSMLWTLMCTAMFFFSLNEAGIFALTFGLLAATQVLFLAMIRNAVRLKERDIRFMQAIYLVLILSSPAYITWMTITLMDTSLWGFIIAVMTYFLISPPRSKWTTLLAAIAFGLAPATRPEALLVTPVFIFLLWLRCISTSREHITRMCLFFMGCFVLASIGLTAFRFLHFGWPFPNTYYAKVSPSLVFNLRQGKIYLDRFLLSSSVVGVLSLLLLHQAASWFGLLADRARFRLFRCPMSAKHAVTFGTLTLIVVPVLTGGDHFGLYRFFQPIYPMMLLAGCLSISELSAFPKALSLLTWSACRKSLISVITIGFIILYWLLDYSSSFTWTNMFWCMPRYSMPIINEFNIAKAGIEAGKDLNDIFLTTEPKPIIGVITAGGIARTYKGKIIDLMGLNNSFIAHYPSERNGIKNHAAFELDAFFQREPDILLASPPVTTNDFANLVLKGLFEYPQFTGRWTYGSISRNGNTGVVRQVFLQKDFLNHLSLKGTVDFTETMIWSNKWVEVTVVPERQN